MNKTIESQLARRAWTLTRLGCLVLALQTSPRALAGNLSASFNDSVVNVALTFDNTTGNYSVTWTDAGTPFSGDLFFFLNLEDLNTVNPNPGHPEALVQSAFGVTISAPTTTYTYTGTATGLIGWNAGDTLKTADTAFDSGVEMAVSPFTSLDILNTTAVVVPEPSAVALVLFGLTGLALRRPRRLTAR